MPEIAGRAGAVVSVVLRAFGNPESAIETLDGSSLQIAGQAVGATAPVICEFFAPDVGPR